MYARSTTTTAQTSMIDQGIRFTQEELLPTLTSMDGCIGLSTLVDRSTGRCISTSSWQTEEAMRASARAIQPLRDQYLMAIGGSAPTIDEWEVALMHRDHHSMEGACARTSWLQGDPMSIEDSIDAAKATMPTLEGFSGFCSAGLLVNRDTGLSALTVVYDGADNIAQTRAQANALRSQVAERANADVIEVAEFELAVAHLRIPELV